jgi:hypothetical protein
MRMPPIVAALAGMAGAQRGRAVSAGRLTMTVLVSAMALMLTGAAPAFAEGPSWRTATEVAPSYLPPGGEGQVVAVVSNLGDGEIEGSKSPVTITDKLPAGLLATAITARAQDNTPVECVLATLKCTYAGVLYPYQRLQFTIQVKVQEPSGAVASLPNEVSVEGGGAAEASSVHDVTVNGERTPFGLQSYELLPLDSDGTPSTQAGSHPFQLTTTFVLNQTVASTAPREPAVLAKDLRFNLPPGLIGNPNAVSQCTMADFAALVDETNLCPSSSVVGVASVSAYEPIAKLLFDTVPVFNLVPAPGEPARFGFEVAKVPVIIDTAVRTGRDYGVVATVTDATQAAGILSSQVTLWGVPGDPRHNESRGWECVAGGVFANQVGKPCPASSELPQEPFLTMPTSCPANPSAEPLTSSTEADSWAQPGHYIGAEYAWLNVTGEGLNTVGCEQLPFTPEISVTPETHSASTPTGLTVEVKVPQKTTLEAVGLAEADVRDTTVTLPGGVQLSPAAANGLEACSEEQIGFVGLDQASQTEEFTPQTPACPEGSKVGVVHIKTPLLSHELEGSIYLASPAPDGEAGRNPFDSFIALYLVAEDPVSGVLVKLAGEGHIEEGSLRVATTFRNAPQVPFESLELELFGGPRASVATPVFCGDYGTDAAFTPWSGTGTLQLVSSPEEFNIASGAGGAPCPAGRLPFSPGFDAQSSDTQAGAFSGFQLELTRPDGDQALSAVSMHLPSGVAALLSSVELCPEAQAAASACPAGSEIGKAIAVAGLGSEPFVQEGGRVFITGPHGGAPFGLEIVSPADAGPFDLGYITVRSKLYIDPNDASVTIASDPLPTQIRGIPLQLKRVIVDVDKPDFQFNPTSCEPRKIEGTITGAEGAIAGVSSPFEIGDCQSLPFSPQLTASALGNGSKADGTTFAVTVRSGGVDSSGVAQAGIAKVDLQLPKQLSSRLPTLQKACPEAAFDANPATCDEGSVIGYATIHTPVLKNPLSGPAYLVSHGNAAFPDVEFVLQGEGIELILDGKTEIKNGITYSKFESTPDAPFTVFETVLPAGPHGVLTPNVTEKKHFDLCGETLAMPTTIVGQDGNVIERNTRVAIEGCGAVKSAKARKLSNAQKLARALKVCRKQYRHSKAKRIRCERHARRRYPPAKAARKGKPARKITGKG